MARVGIRSLLLFALLATASPAPAAAAKSVKNPATMVVAIKEHVVQCAALR